MRKSTQPASEVKRAAAVLDRARAKNQRPAPPFECTSKPVTEAAVRVLHYIREEQAVECELDASKDLVRRRLDGIVARAALQGDPPTSVEVPTLSGRLRVTYKDAYYSLKIEAAPAIQAVVGNDDFNRFFELTKSIKIKSAEIAGEDRLAAVVNELTAALGEDRFCELFSVSLGVAPTTEFTVRRHRDLTTDQLDQLADLGVEQQLAWSIVKEE